MITKAKSRSRDRIKEKIGEYKKRSGYRLRLPPASVIEKMTGEQLLAWVRKTINKLKRRNLVVPTMPADGGQSMVSNAEVALSYPLKRKKIKGKTISYRIVEKAFGWQDRHGKYVEDFYKGKARRNSRKLWKAHKEKEKKAATVA